MDKRTQLIISILALASSIIGILVIFKKLDFSFELSELTISIIGALIGVYLSFLLSSIIRKSKSKRVLITYANSDLEEAIRINNFLLTKKVSSVLLDYVVQVGDPIDNIKYISKNVDIIIVLISKDIHKAKSIKNIINHSISQKKKIFPIIVDESKLPNNLSNYGYIDVSNNEELALNDLYKKIISI